MSPAGLAAMLTVFLTVSGASGLGTPLRVEGFSIRPPNGFRMVNMEPYLGTRVGAVSSDLRADRTLVAALEDGESDDASRLLISRVDRSFAVVPSARDEFATAAVRHFADELGLTLVMERVERVEGPVPRIEVLATVRQEGQIRQIVLAGMAGEGRHCVLMFSVPASAFADRAADIRASLDSFRNDPAITTSVPRAVAGAVAGAMAGGLLASFALWRRLRALKGR